MPSPDAARLLRARLKKLLSQAEELTARERLIVERHFRLNDQAPRPPYATYTAIAKELRISAPRVSQIENRTMRQLRKRPEFCQAMNAYLRLFPYLRRGRGRGLPTWLGEDGLLEPLGAYGRSGPGAPTRTDP